MIFNLFDLTYKFSTTLNSSIGSGFQHQFLNLRHSLEIQFLKFLPRDLIHENHILIFSSFSFSVSHSWSTVFILSLLILVEFSYIISRLSHTFLVVLQLEPKFYSLSLIYHQGLFFNTLLHFSLFFYDPKITQFFTTSFLME